MNRFTVSRSSADEDNVAIIEQGPDEPVEPSVPHTTTTTQPSPHTSRNESSGLIPPVHMKRPKKRSAFKKYGSTHGTGKLALCLLNLVCSIFLIAFAITQSQSRHSIIISINLGVPSMRTWFHSWLAKLFGLLNVDAAIIRLVYGDLPSQCLLPSLRDLLCGLLLVWLVARKGTRLSEWKAHRGRPSLVDI